VFSEFAMPAAPCPISGCTLSADPAGEVLWLVGGWNGLGPVGRCFAYLVRARIWKEVGKISPRCAHAAAAIDGKLYVFGGWNGASVLDDCQRIGSHTLAWEKLSTRKLPPGRSGHSATCLRQRMMIFGGWNSEGHRNDTHVLDIPTARWAEVTGKERGMPPSPREGHTATTVGDTVVIFGGHGPLGRLSDLHLFHPPRLQWEQVQPHGAPPPPISSHTAEALGGAVIVFGGKSADGTSSRLYSFDLGSRHWLSVKCKGRWGHASAVTVQSTLAVVGGYGDKPHPLADLRIIPLPEPVPEPPAPELPAAAAQPAPRTDPAGVGRPAPPTAPAEPEEPLVARRRKRRVLRDACGGSEPGPNLRSGDPAETGPFASSAPARAGADVRAAPGPAGPPPASTRPLRAGAEARAASPDSLAGSSDCSLASTDTESETESGCETPPVGTTRAAPVSARKMVEGRGAVAKEGVAAEAAPVGVSWFTPANRAWEQQRQETAARCAAAAFIRPRHKKKARRSKKARVSAFIDDAAQEGEETSAEDSEPEAAEADARAALVWAQHGQRRAAVVRQSQTLQMLAELLREDAAFHHKRSVQKCESEARARDKRRRLV